MTTKLVLERPKDSLKFMKDWCIQMQQQLKAEKESKVKHDTYDDEVMNVIEQKQPTGNSPTNQSETNERPLSASEASIVELNTPTGSSLSAADDEDDVVSNISGDNTEL